MLVLKAFCLALYFVCVRRYVELQPNAFSLLVQGQTAKSGGGNKTLMILFLYICARVQMYTFIFVCVTLL